MGNQSLLQKPFMIKDFFQICNAFSPLSLVFSGRPLPADNLLPFYKMAAYRSALGSDHGITSSCDDALHTSASWSSNT